MRHMSAVIGTALAVALAFSPPAFSSSDFAAGRSAAQDPEGRETNTAVCRLFIGPRDSVEAGTFLLRFADVGATTDEDVLELRGTVVRDDQGEVTLVTDEAHAEDFYEQILRIKLQRSASEFDLHRLLVTVRRTPDDIGVSHITCDLQLVGFLVDAGSRHPGGKASHTSGRVVLNYEGQGVVFPGLEGPAAASKATTEGGAPLPVSETTCDPPNFAPKPEFCDKTPGNSCLVTFKGYQWWTSYNFFSPPATPPTSQNSGFWNNYNVWSPRNVEVHGDEMHLFVQQQQTLDDQGNCCITRWTSAEAVTALNPDGTVAKLGYGTYLVAARVATASSWASLDPNVAFGAFTYERATTGDMKNPPRELDLAEISRWGRQGTEQACRDDWENVVLAPVLCDGNAQFTLQMWDQNPDNIHRYTITGDDGTLTLVMIWPGPQQAATFRQYNGLHTLDSLPAQPNNEWIIPAAQFPWVPADGCQQFHLNLWMGSFKNRAEKGFNNPPVSGQVQKVIVTNFEYRPL